MTADISAIFFRDLLLQLANHFQQFLHVLVQPAFFDIAVGRFLGLGGIQRRAGKGHAHAFGRLGFTERRGFSLIANGAGFFRFKQRRHHGAGRKIAVDGKHIVSLQALGR
ncbi:hypothetical protein [Pseudomonas hygromyciniae]|uniref:hypothetical protein n=1 Tax=Pseudomonas hygromyciniae TaxID=2812000 RepID=UPI001F0763FA|nr:hypothetical protein [Pseudomonas hygromyciniae]